MKEQYDRLGKELTSKHQEMGTLKQQYQRLIQGAGLPSGQGYKTAVKYYFQAKAYSTDSPQEVSTTEISDNALDELTLQYVGYGGIKDAQYQLASNILATGVSQEKKKQMKDRLQKAKKASMVSKLGW